MTYHVFSEKDECLCMHNNIMRVGVVMQVFTPFVNNPGRNIYHVDIYDSAGEVEKDYHLNTNNICPVPIINDRVDKYDSLYLARALNRGISEFKNDSLKLTSLYKLLTTSYPLYNWTHEGSTIKVELTNTNTNDGETFSLSVRGTLLLARRLCDDSGTSCNYFDERHVCDNLARALGSFIDKHMKPLYVLA
jgi:hypothetical protein